MRANGGRTVLMDFGAGRELSIEPAAPGSDFAGTPIYLAPEVFAGASRTTASDIYSLGVLLYFLVTGSYPVEGATRSEIRRFHDQRGSRRPLRTFVPICRTASFAWSSARWLRTRASDSRAPVRWRRHWPARSRPHPPVQENGRASARHDWSASPPRSSWSLRWRRPRLIDWGPLGSGTPATAPATAAATPNPALAVTPGDEYRIDASFYKERDQFGRAVSAG
jgi:serine/threonine protein kinase